MDQKCDSKSHATVPVHPERRMRQERRSLSESFADGTSKFFSSVVAKKNGFFSDLSSRIENTFLSKPDMPSNGSGSNRHTTPPGSTHGIDNPPQKPPPSSISPSVNCSREGNVMKRMSSLPAYSRTNSKPDVGRKSSPNRRQLSDQGRITSQERFSVNGMNVSFDEPIYNRSDVKSSLPITDISVTDAMLRGTRIPRTRHVSCSSALSKSKLKPEPQLNQPETRRGKSPSSCLSHNSSPAGNVKVTEIDNEINQNEDRLRTLNKTRKNEISKVGENNICADKKVGQLENSNKYIQERRPSAESGRHIGDRDSKSDNAHKTEPMTDVDNQKANNAPSFTTTKLRSNTVDEILFDDYIKPDVDVIIPKEKPPDNLISFEPEVKVVQEINSPGSASDGNDMSVTGAIVDPSIAELGGIIVHRSASIGSDKSWSSVYSVDSQPDDVTIESMDFMKNFVDKIFHNSDEISQTEKAKFGELCQHFPGRLWFSRYVSSQRVHNKKVAESVFFSLMQYFAVCLFECNEADDFSPAKTLMNMCFTFYYEGPTQKVFLYMYMREQPIWQSLRFWNAAYFDAVQCERARRPMPTNSDGNETVSDDKQFQENITFGQLGTFACNMRGFGLSKELCLEFLRKQSTIANLGKEQVKLLKENIERAKDD